MTTEQDKLALRPVEDYLQDLWSPPAGEHQTFNECRKAIVQERDRAAMRKGAEMMRDRILREMDAVSLPLTTVAAKNVTVESLLEESDAE